MSVQTDVHVYIHTLKTGGRLHVTLPNAALFVPAEINKPCMPISIHMIQLSILSIIDSKFQQRKFISCCHVALVSSVWSLH